MAIRKKVDPESTAVRSLTMGELWREDLEEILTLFRAAAADVDGKPGLADREYSYDTLDDVKKQRGKRTGALGFWTMGFNKENPGTLENMSLEIRGPWIVLSARGERMRPYALKVRQVLWRRHANAIARAFLCLVAVGWMWQVLERPDLAFSWDLLYRGNVGGHGFIAAVGFGGTYALLASRLPIRHTFLVVRGDVFETLRTRLRKLIYWIIPLLVGTAIGVLVTRWLGGD